MRLPIVAYGVARLTHAPSAVGLFECGIVRTEPAAATLHTMGDPANQQGAAWCTGTCNLLGMMQAGRVDVGFIGGAEIDRFGNINSSYIGDFRAPAVKLPGSGGAADSAATARRLVASLNHDKRRLVPRGDHGAPPGWVSGRARRAAA